MGAAPVVVTLSSLISAEGLNLLFMAGSTDVAVLGKRRTFLSYPHCRESLNLTKGKTYLLMGTSKDIHTDRNAQT